jgi:hypothetical protein
MRSITALWQSLLLAPLLLGRTAAAQDTPQFRTPDDVSSFIQTYYQQPRPELIGSLIRSFSSVGLAQRPHAAPPLIAFLSEVFAANPSRMAEWRAIPIEDHRQTTRRAGPQPEQVWRRDLPLGEAGLDDEVPPLDPAELAKPLAHACRALALDATLLAAQGEGAHPSDLARRLCPRSERRHEKAKSSSDERSPVH